MLLFRCGAMVAHSTVNRVVTGSSPVTGAKNKKGCSLSYKGRPFLISLEKFFFIADSLHVFKNFPIKIFIIKENYLISTRPVWFGKFNAKF